MKIKKCYKTRKVLPSCRLHPYMKTLDKAGKPCQWPFYKHIIINVDTRVIRMMLQFVVSPMIIILTTLEAPTIVILMTLEVSFMLLENTYRQGLLMIIKRLL